MEKSRGSYDRRDALPGERGAFRGGKRAEKRRDSAVSECRGNG